MLRRFSRSKLIKALLSLRKSVQSVAIMIYPLVGLLHYFEFVKLLNTTELLQYIFKTYNLIYSFLLAHSAEKSKHIDCNSYP